MHDFCRPSIYLEEVIKKSSVETLKSFKCSSGAFLELFEDTSAVFVSPFEGLLDSFRGPSGVHRRTSRVLRGSIGLLRGFFGGTLEVFVVLPCSSGVLPWSSIEFGRFCGFFGGSLAVHRRFLMWFCLVSKLLSIAILCLTHFLAGDQFKWFLHPSI